MNDYDIRICDNCEYFDVHPSGVSENCHKIRIEDYGIGTNLTKDYAEKRMDGSKRTCKGFKRIILTK